MIEKPPLYKWGFLFFKQFMEAKNLNSLQIRTQSAIVVSCSLKRGVLYA